uniref:ATP-grasp domain-containing protein n=3 Tax=Roseivirga sp. TaxID=1964215 RepID=UPI004047D6DB
MEEIIFGKIFQMPTLDLVVATCDKYSNPIVITPYVQNILTEDGLVVEAFERKGLKVARKSWADLDFDWAETKMVLIRTTWDYFDRYEEWQNWLALVASKARLINPIEIIRWNMDKHYLGDLKARGVNIPETIYIETGSQTSLSDLHAKTGWKETILKPCVSGASRHTYKLNLDNLAEHEQLFQNLVAKEAFMLQPFQKNVVEKGEISMMVMGGQVTHAVLKIAKPGDFRVQDDFGGSVHNYQANAEEIAFAEKAVAACHPTPFYARVDVIKDNNDQLAIIELELIEPELWFRLMPSAAQVLANSIE